MERGERSGGGGAEKAENLWEKLRRVGKRGGNSTPAASFWRTNELGSKELHDSRNIYQGATFGLISSRKLAAALWDLHYYKLPPLDNLRRGVTAPPRLRHHKRRPYKDMGGPEPLDPLPTSDMPESLSKLRRHVAESLMQHHRSIEKRTRAAQTVSPSSCGSSMERASCNPATPSSSIELRGRSSESTYSLRTSTELIKVLCRIWSLEEQHVSNTSIIKALKKELDRARFHAKELAREQQGDRLEMDELMKCIAGGKLLRKNKEQDRINATNLSTRDELENERKLRKRLESLQRKLAQELYEVKTSLTSISKELEEERVSRGLLEDLCDELACGLIDCEKELHDLRKKPDKDSSEGADHDRLILRISQAWLHERMQVKQEHWLDVAEKNQNIDMLSSEIEAFLHGERNSKANINGNQMQRNPMVQKSSLESIPLNVGASAPRDEDDDGSSGSHSDCFEMEKTSEAGMRPQGQKLQENHCEEMLKRKEFKEKLAYSNRKRALSPPLLQAKFEEHMARAMSYCESRNQVENLEQITVGQGNQCEVGISQKSEFLEAARDNMSEHKHESEGINKLDSKYAIENLIRNYYSFSESGMQPSKDHVVTSSLWRNSQSPVREWTEKLPPQDLNISETPLRFLPELKNSTLREKLFAAGTGGQKSRSRQKASIFPSRDE